MERINRTFRDQRSALEKYADEQIKERVLCGLELLREQYGEDWVEHINPKTLKLENTTYCVLGQINGNAEGYFTEVRKIENKIPNFNPDEFGFSASDNDDYYIVYKDLTEAWLLAITGDPL